MEGAAVVASDRHPCAIKSKSPVPMFHTLWCSSGYAYSERLRKQVRGAAAGRGDVRVVVGFVPGRVAKCRLHRVLLLLLSDDLLQGKIGIDLVGILLGAQFEEQGLIDALE